MHMVRLAVLVLLPLLVLAGPAAQAHPGHDHPADMRVWRDRDGWFEMEASFLLARGDQVQLCKHDGATVWVPLDRLSDGDRAWVRDRVAAIRRLNGEAPPAPATEGPPPALAGTAVLLVAALVAGVRLVSRRRAAIPGAVTALLIGALAMPAAGKEDRAVTAIRKHFEPFQAKVKFRADADYFYLESDGFPDYPMMVGITAWQQQVPLPQPYTGRNAWQVPLHPRLADKPISGRRALYSGAIAVAVNGVPIFNALNNRGEDAFLAGELDEYGGHCGRGDDYHYHVAPVHLEKVVGKGNPIGYALDGFPLYGLTDADGLIPRDLDEFNGRMEAGGYRYYSTKTYPYINGGLRGVVTVRNDRVEPQPRDAPVRPAGRPLRGAKITAFVRDDQAGTYTVKYEVQGQAQAVRYTINPDGSYTFVSTDGSGRETTETYRRREPRGGPPPRPDGPAPAVRPDARGKFTVTSPAFAHGGKLPAEFTGDGDGVSPPLAWSNAPAGTKCFALHLWHRPFPDRDEVKSYWILYNIPADVTSLPRNVKGVGKAGYNDKNRPDYDPMRSRGPGPKEYHVTLYALAAEPRFTTDRVTRADLLTAVKDITLAESTLSYTYERQGR